MAIRKTHAHRGFKRGAIAIVDALGFKGIWAPAEHPNLEALQTLRAVKKAIEARAKGWQARLKKPDAKPWGLRRIKFDFYSVFMSDTVAVAVVVSGSAGHRMAEKTLRTGETIEHLRESLARTFLVDCISHGLGAAALAPRPLAFRGTISVGPLLLRGPFLIGPAVDEAASLMDIADGPFVWFAPSAARLRLITALASDVYPYRVPLRDGRFVKTQVLDPFAACSSADRKTAVDAVRRSMTVGGIEVAIKLQNFERFVELMKSHRRQKELTKKRREGTARKPG